ncbi:M48 family metalloprotease [Pleurocapsales cyanobacterium LEGE 10410]|nr:M48 family metalloprotease [Pleurocapsales cyanobacterium LEGE 10410]
MKFLNLCLIIVNLLLPTATLAQSSESKNSSDRAIASQLDVAEENELEPTPDSEAKTENAQPAAEEDSPSEEAEPESAEDISEEDRVVEPTPEERARLEKLAKADRLYLAGDKVAAVKLYREAKETWEIEQEAGANELTTPVFEDPAQLSPGGKVFWRNYQQGKEQQLETKVLTALKLLTTREPEFIPGHIHYAEALLKYELEDKSAEVLERAVNLYPNEPKILKAKMNADIAAEQWLDASVTARQFALFNPNSPQAKEFERLAEEYLAEYQSDLRSNITWNAIGNAIAGIAGFALTGNLFGPLSALQTTTLLLNGESAVGEASVGHIKKQVPLLQNQKVTQYVNQIGQKIALVSGRDEFDYEFYVIMDDTLNAFALPGGKIFVHAGAIMNTDSEAELAGLLAHEVSHAALSHGFQLVTKGNLTANVVSYIPYVGNAASSLIVLDYSRDMEKQADIYGTKILVNAGYAADGVRNLMAQLHEQHQQEERSQPPAWLSTHPNSEQRINYMEELIVERKLDRYGYEGVARHQEIKKLVTTKWQEYEKCVEEVYDIEEAKICAGEKDRQQQEVSEQEQRAIDEAPTEPTEPTDRESESESEALIEDEQD